MEMSTLHIKSRQAGARLAPEFKGQRERERDFHQWPGPSREHLAHSILEREGIRIQELKLMLNDRELQRESQVTPKKGCPACLLGQNCDTLQVEGGPVRHN